MKQYKRFGDTFIQENFTQEQSPPPPPELPGYTSTDTLPLYDVPPNVQHQEYEKENAQVNTTKAIRSTKMPRELNTMYPFEAVLQQQPQQPSYYPTYTPTSSYPVYTPSTGMPSYPVYGTGTPSSSYPVYPPPVPSPSYPVYAPSVSTPLYPTPTPSYPAISETEETSPRKWRRRGRIPQEPVIRCDVMKQHIKQCKWCARRLQTQNNTMLYYLIGILVLIIVYLISTRSDN